VLGKYGEKYANIATSLSTQIAFYKGQKIGIRFANLISKSIRVYPPKVNGYTFANITGIGKAFQRDDWN